MTQPKPIRIMMSFDDWVAISDAVVETAGHHRQPRLFDLAARIEQEIGLTSIASCHRAEGRRLARDLSNG